KPRPNSRPPRPRDCRTPRAPIVTRHPPLAKNWTRTASEPTAWIRSAPTPNRCSPTHHHSRDSDARGALRRRRHPGGFELSTHVRVVPGLPGGKRRRRGLANTPVDRHGRRDDAGIVGRGRRRAGPRAAQRPALALLPGDHAAVAAVARRTRVVAGRRQ